MQEGDNRNNGSNNSRSILMALVACYIIYLGVSILRGMFRGEGGMPFGLGVFFGIAFVAAGGAYLIYLLRQFLMSGSARKDEAAGDTAKAVIEKEGGISGAEENASETEAPEKQAEKLPEKPAEKPAEKLTEELPEKPAEDTSDQT